ncbi:MAG: hypothetical protein L3J04_00650 [Robiginitomaculum sp.]|nr:hypothetical protein [Robiginitomaculum sp.]
MKISSSYYDNWKKLGKLLGLEVDIITSLELGVDIGFDEIILLKEFGFENGMLLLPNAVSKMPNSDLLAKKGYGYSILKAPSKSFLEELETCIEMLADWKGVAYKAFGLSIRVIGDKSVTHKKRQKLQQD